MPNFDDPDYSDDLKIENAAELLAILIMYPLDDIDRDRTAFLKDGAHQDDFEDAEVIAAVTLPYATEYRVPNRYVDVLFRWHKFNEVYLLYCQLRDGY